MADLRDDIEAICNDKNTELYDIEIDRDGKDTIFRVTIIEKDGTTLEKCTEISRLISPLLDVNPPIGGEYRLEVSSPGIERNLTTPKHYKLSIGEKIKIKLISGDKVVGKLIDANKNEFSIETDFGIEKYNYSDIKKAKTYFEW